MLSRRRSDKVDVWYHAASCSAMINNPASTPMTIVTVVAAVWRNMYRHAANHTAAMTGMWTVSNRRTVGREKRATPPLGKHAATANTANASAQPGNDRAYEAFDVDPTVAEYAMSPTASNTAPTNRPIRAPERSIRMSKPSIEASTMSVSG